MPPDPRPPGRGTMASIVLSTLLATGLFLWFGGSLFAFVLIYQIETLTLVGLGQAARSLAAPGAPLPATVRVVAPAFLGAQALFFTIAGFLLGSAGWAVLGREPLWLLVFPVLVLQYGLPLLRAGLSGGRPALAALATAWDQGFLHRLFLQQFLVILTFGVAMLALDGPPSRRFLLESIAMAVYGAARIALEWQLSREGRKTRP